MKYYKRTYLDYIFNHVLPTLVWFYREGLSLQNDEAALNKEKDFNEIVSFSNELKQYMKKFDPKVKSEHFFFILRSLLLNIERICMTF